MARLNYKEVLKGDKGTTFTPHVTEEGLLYWKNDGGLINPTPVNIQGKQGEQGEIGRLTEEQEQKIDRVINDYNDAISNLTNGNESATNSEIVQARNGEVNLNRRLDKFDSQLEQMAKKDDVARISSGTPLFASSTSEMSDTTRNYVNTTDGYLYNYSSGSWTKTNMLYQSSGINNRSIEQIHINSNITNGIYPFDSETSYVKSKSGILNFEVYNQTYKNLFLERVYRKCDIHADGSNIVTTININSGSEVIAQLNVSSYEESSPIERIKLTNLKNDGAEYYITINWDKFTVNDYSQKNFTINQTKFHINCYKNSLALNSIIDKKITELVEISLPSVCYGVVGQEFNIYFDNVIKCNNIKNYQVDVWCDKGQHLEECFRIVPDVEGDIGIRILVYKDFNKTKKLAEKLIVLKVKSNKNITNTGILLGDSITDFNVYPVELKKLMPNVTFLGTRGTNETCKHEGRGGWTSNDYVTLPNKGSVVNPFYNPSTKTFDFQYYCENNGLSNTTIDFFVIELGINDIAQGYEVSKIIENYNKIITSVTTYRPICKIIIDFTIPPCGQDGFGKNNGSGKTSWEQRSGVFNFVKELIIQYDYKTSRNIYINPMNLGLDTINNFPFEEVNINARNTTKIKRYSDNVHPGNSGYYQLADFHFYCLNYIFG